jgi:hypothetical protein
MDKIEEAKFREKHKRIAKNIGAALSIIIFLVIIIDAFVFVWRFMQSYGNEVDFVCFNQDCNYIQANEYSINGEGTCLTRRDSGSSVEQCGGSIEVTKPYTSFWDRLQAVQASMEATSSENASPTGVSPAGY